MKNFTRALIGAVVLVGALASSSPAMGVEGAEQSYAAGGGLVSEVNFSFSAGTDDLETDNSSNPQSVRATCHISDPTTGTEIRCIDGREFYNRGNWAIVTGTAVVNGVEQGFYMVVQDNGDTDSGLDHLTIYAGTYVLSGPVTHGNIMVGGAVTNCDEDAGIPCAY